MTRNAPTGEALQQQTKRKGRVRTATPGGTRSAGCDSTPLLPIVPLTRDELPLDTVELARFMVGKYLVYDLAEPFPVRGVPGIRNGEAEPVLYERRLSGRIVEMEAYPVGDSTSHAFIGRRAWNGSMFLERGHAYVRLTYGTEYMLNMSSELAGIGAGVLIRAIEPLEGIAAMTARRNGAPLRDLARGPGRLTRAFGIGQAFDGQDLCTGHGLWIGQMPIHGDAAVKAVAATKRIGLSREMHHMLRFYEAGSPFVSGPRKLLAAQ
ncbi:DNA-3-methyladenine glycosylase [Paraburkholderia kururiensis]